MLPKNILKKISSAAVILSVSAGILTPQLAGAEEDAKKRTTWDRGGVSLGFGTGFDATSGVGSYEASLQGQSRAVRESNEGASTLFHRHSRVGILVPVAKYATTAPFSAQETGAAIGVDGQVRADFTVTRNELPALQEKKSSIKPAFYGGIDAGLRASLVDILGAAQFKQLDTYLTVSGGPALTLRMDPAKLRLVIAAIAQGAVRVAGTQVTDLSSGQYIPGVKTGFAGLELGGKVLLALDDRLIVTTKLTTSVLGANIPIPGIATGGTHGELDASVRVAGPFLVEAKGKVSHYYGGSLDSAGATIGEGHVFLTIAN